MQIQNYNQPNTGDRRARQIVDDIRYKLASAVSHGERDGFDSTGRYSHDVGHSSEHLLARFSSSFSTEVQVDPKSEEVLQFCEQSKGGRSSYWVGDRSELSRSTFQRQGNESTYTETRREFSPTRCESFTERVKVSADGQMHYTKTEHLDGQVERFLRNNPSVRQLGGQALGGAIGGLVGVLVGAHAGLPVNWTLAAGTSVGAFLGGGLAQNRPSIQNSSSGLELAAAIPAFLVQTAAGLGSVGVVLATLIASSGH